MENTVLDSSSEVLSTRKKQKPWMFVFKYGGVLFACLVLKQAITTSMATFASLEVMSKATLIGIVLVTCLYPVLIILALLNFQKDYPNTGVLKMTALGTLICFAAFLSHEVLMIPFYVLGKSQKYFFISTIVMRSFLALIISFYTAYYLKTRSIVKLVLALLGLVLLFGYLVNTFPFLQGKGAP